MPRNLLVILVLPFLICLTILVSIPGIERKLLIQSVIVFAVLWTIGGTTCAAFVYLEDREQAGGPARPRLLWVACLLVPMLLTVLVLSRVH